MHSLHTAPTPVRKGVAILLVLVCAIVAVMDKVDRDFDTGLTAVPGILSGTWPNFSVVLISVTLLFVTNSRMPYRKFVKYAFGGAAGATIYEIAQLWIPSRTFDWSDILASLAGALASIGVARIAFYKRALRENAAMGRKN